MKVTRNLLVYLVMHNAPFQFLMGYSYGIGAVSWGHFWLVTWSISKFIGDIWFFRVMKHDVVGGGDE